MKEITKSSRLLGQLEKLYRMLNHDWFDDELGNVVITVQSSPTAYAHIVLENAWTVKDSGLPELNIGAGTLDRPIEHIVASLMHEMCHLLNHQRGIKDTSNRGVYHNIEFKKVGEAHGLIIDRSDRYGWTITNPADELIDYLLENNLQDILLCRNESGGIRIAGGGKAANGGIPTTGKKPSSTRKLICPCCGQSVRATRAVNILCGDCLVRMVEV